MTITIALPSKGRMKEDSLACLAKAGLSVDQPADARSYKARVAGMNGVEIAFLSASEIARELALGNVDLGVTGEDLVREAIADWSSRMEIEARLGFGAELRVIGCPRDARLERCLGGIDFACLAARGDARDHFPNILFGGEMVAPVAE